MLLAALSSHVVRRSVPLVQFLFVPLLWLTFLANWKSQVIKTLTAVSSTLVVRSYALLIAVSAWLTSMEIVSARLATNSRGKYALLKYATILKSFKLTANALAQPTLCGTITTIKSVAWTRALTPASVKNPRKILKEYAFQNALFLRRELLQVSV
jgi:hypothetical protein